jgi:hypothetical protein
VIALLVGFVLTFFVPFGFTIGWVFIIAGVLAINGGYSIFTLWKIHYAIIGPIALVTESSLAIWYNWYFLATQGYIVMPIALASLCFVMIGWSDLRKRTVALHFERRPIDGYLYHR